MSIENGNWAIGKGRENTERNKDLEEIRDNGIKWTKMKELTSNRREIWISKMMERVHVHLLRVGMGLVIISFGTQGNHFSASLWVLGETEGEVGFFTDSDGCEV